MLHYGADHLASGTSLLFPPPSSYIFLSAYVFLRSSIMLTLPLRLDIIADSPATQCYTGNYLDTPRKTVHGGPKLKYSPYSAVAIELQGWVDAINHPEWGVDQFCKCYYRPSCRYLLVGLILTCENNGWGTNLMLILVPFYLFRVDEPGKDFKWSTTYKFSILEGGSDDD